MVIARPNAPKSWVRKVDQDDMVMMTPLPGTRPAPRRPGAGRPAALGCAATTALAVVTSGWLRSPFLATVIGLVAMGLIVLTWLGLYRRLGAGLRPRQLYGLSAAWCLPLLAARPLFSGDVWSYLAQGQIAAGGLDPYRLGPLPALGSASAIAQHVSHYWINTPAPYGPAWITLSHAGALLVGSRLAAGVLMYRLVALAGVVLIGWALPRLARRVGVAPATALWLGLLNPLVLWHLVAGVHNDALMLGLLLAGCELALRDGPVTRLLAGTALLTIALNIKFVAGTAVVCVAADLLRRRRPARALLALAVAASGTILFSLLAGFGWTTSAWDSTSVYSWMSPTTVAGCLAGALIGPHVTATAVTVAHIAGVVVCLPIVTRLLLRVYRGRLHPVRGLGLIFLTVLLCAPVVQPWYLLWAILPLAATARTPGTCRLVSRASAVAALVLPPVAMGAAPLTVIYLVAAALLGAIALAGRARATAAGQPAAGSPVTTRTMKPGSSRVRAAWSHA